MVRRVLIVVLIYFGLCLAGGVFLASITLHPQRRALDASSIPFSAVTNVSLTVADGAQLRAWYILPDEEISDVVLLLHGLSDKSFGNGWIRAVTLGSRIRRADAGLPCARR